MRHSYKSLTWPSGPGFRHSNKSMAANPVNVIALAPPLIVSTDEIDEGVAIMDIALEAADAHTE